MRSTPSEPDLDPDLVQTQPASKLSLQVLASPPDSWDSEAPTAVHARRPLFAGPPRLPRT